MFSADGHRTSRTNPLDMNTTPLVAGKFRLLGCSKKVLDSFASHVWQTIPPKKRGQIVACWTFGTPTSWNLFFHHKKSHKNTILCFNMGRKIPSELFDDSKPTKPSWTKPPWGHGWISPPFLLTQLGESPWISSGWQLNPMMSMMKSLHLMGKSHNIPMISMMKFLLKVECSLKSDLLIPWISGEISSHWLNSISGHACISMNFWSIFPKKSWNFMIFMISPSCHSIQEFRIARLSGGLRHVQ